MLILLINSNKYTIGFFTGFCQSVDCKLKSVEIECDDKTFFSLLKKDSPTLVFIHVKFAIKILSFAKSTEDLLFLKENNISLCVIGKFPPNYEDTTLKTLVKKNLITRLNNKDIMNFVNSEILAISERRSYERRNMIERRKSHKKRDSTSFNIDTSLVNTTKVFDITDDTTPLYCSPGNTLKMSDATKINSDLKRHLNIGPLHIDYTSKSVLINGSPVVISPKEFEMIALLAMRPGDLVKTEEFISKVWPKSNHATKSDVHQYMYILRHKLEENPHKPKLLITVRGFGYKLSFPLKTGLH